LPSPADPVSVQRKKFADQGLSDHDLVTLVGAHTIGQTDCQFFSYRLYNFTATGNADPTISQASLAQLRALCPPPSGAPAGRRVALDEGSPDAFDVSFFKNVRDGGAVLESDQRLWSDAATQGVVQKYAGNVRGLFGPQVRVGVPQGHGEDEQHRGEDRRAGRDQEEVLQDQLMSERDQAPPVLPAAWDWDADARGGLAFTNGSEFMCELTPSSSTV